MLWIVLIFIIIFILSNSKSKNVQKIIHPQNQLTENFSRVIKTPTSFSLLPSYKCSIQELSDRVSAKSSKNYSNYVLNFLTDDRKELKNFNEHFSIYKLIQEYQKNSNVYKNLIETNQDLNIIKIYCIKRWLISAKKNTFKIFLENVNNLLKNTKIRNPSLLKKLIDEEILKFS